MFRRFIPLVIAAFLVLTVSCSPKILSGDDRTNAAKAYLEVVSELYHSDVGLNAARYLACDLSKILYEDRSKLEKELSKFCQALDLTFICGTYNDLVKKGLIVSMYFEDGVLITFEDIVIGPGYLKTSATKYRSPLGAIGAVYTVKYQSGSWKITKTENAWIS
jgi:hypothetical protein